jgi:predicted transcriptional regulator
MTATTRPHQQPATVDDLMANEPIVVRAEASLGEAARLLDDYDISGLPVVAADGDLVGVISETDLVHARATEWLWANWTGLEVRHLMTRPPITIGRTASLDAGPSRWSVYMCTGWSWSRTTNPPARSA